jgi:hypothetical protein
MCDGSARLHANVRIGDAMGLYCYGVGLQVPTPGDAVKQFGCFLDEMLAGVFRSKNFWEKICLIMS